VRPNFLKIDCGSPVVHYRMISSGSSRFKASKNSLMQENPTRADEKLSRIKDRETALNNIVVWEPIEYVALFSRT
jgi:hypothetical protein